MRTRDGTRKDKAAASPRDNFLCDRRAVTAIEFALIAPILFLSIALVLQVAVFLYFKASLNAAVQSAARQIMVGNVANANPPVTISTFISNYICPQLPSAMYCANIVVNSVAQPPFVLANGNSGWWSMINAGGTGLALPPMDNTRTTFCIGQPGSAIALEVFYLMPTFGFSQVWRNTTTFNGQTVMNIISTAAFKNEQFATNYQGC